MYANTAEAQGILDRANRYGVTGTGEVVGSEYHDMVDHSRTMTLGECVKAGGRITRVRILKEYRPMFGVMCDISYIHATMPDGAIVPIVVTIGGHGIRFGSLKGLLIQWAKEEGVYAIGCGLIDESNWATLG